MNRIAKKMNRHLGRDKIDPDESSEPGKLEITCGEKIDLDDSSKLGKPEMTRRDEIDLDESSELDKPEMTHEKYRS